MLLAAAKSTSWPTAKRTEFNGILVGPANLTNGQALYAVVEGAEEVGESHGCLLRHALPQVHPFPSVSPSPTSTHRQDALRNSTLVMATLRSSKSSRTQP